MRLISLHEDAVRALERLRVPFDDVTPEGLWGSQYHLIGVTAEQRSVLDSWNLEVNDVTPQVISAADLAPQLKESWPQPRPRPIGEMRAEAPAESSRVNSPRAAQPDAHAEPAASAGADAEVPVPMHEEPKKHGDPLGDTAVEREIVGRAAAAAESRSDTSTRQRATNGASTNNRGGATETAAPAKAQQHDPTRLRVSIGGKYREASVKQGKILLDGHTYDSPAAATKSVAPSKNDWVFWEYFDADAGKWRMLDRDWQPGQTS
jgi:hypothetical protein